MSGASGILARLARGAGALRALVHRRDAGATMEHRRDAGATGGGGTGAGGTGGGATRATASLQEFYAWATALTGGKGGGPSAPFAENSAVYSGVRAIAQTIGSFGLVLHRAGDREALLTGGPAYELLERFDSEPTCGNLAEQWAGHLVEGGEAHVLFTRGAASGLVRGMEVIGRRQMEDRRDAATGQLLYWTYTPVGGARRQVLLPEENAYTRLFNPYDPVRGLSPLKAAAMGIRQDYQASIHNATALENGASPGGLFVFPGNISEEERQEFLKALRERLEGTRNANRPWVAGGGVDYKQTSFKNVDLQLIDSRKFNREEIFNALGVPGVIVAIFESAHYDVADKSIEIFVVFTVMPLVRCFERLMNRVILPRIEPGVQCYLDPTHNPVMQRLAWSKLDAHEKALRSGIPYNESIAFLGLPFTRQTWGETSLVQGGLTTAEDVVAGLSVPPEENRDEGTEGRRDEEERDEGTEARRHEGEDFHLSQAGAAAERRFEERQIRAAMPAIKRRFVTHFMRQERRVLARLRRELARVDAVDVVDGVDGKGTFTGGTPVPQWIAGEEDVERIVRRVLLALDEERGRLKKLVREYFPDAAARAVKAELERQGFGPEQIEIVIRKIKAGKSLRGALRVKEIKITRVDDTTRERVRRTLLQGMRSQESISELATRVHTVMGGNRSRALTIARTEAGQAVSTGRFLAAAAAGAKGKAWLTGSNPRPTHVQAGIDYGPAAPIALSEPFQVGSSKLMYPRDPSGEADEIINCNCVMATVRLKKEPEAGGSRAEVDGMDGVDGRDRGRSARFEIVSLIGAADGRG